MNGIGDLDLQAYLDGQLDPEREAELLAWLEVNPEAKERMRAIAEQNLLLRAATLDRDLQHRLRPAPAVPAAAIAAPARRSALPRMAQAAAVLLTFSLGWAAHGVADYMVDGGLPAYAREALQSHEAFAEPLEASIELPAGSRNDVTRWLSAKLGEPVEVPELRSMGLRLVGARLMGTEDGAGAVLIYEDAQHKRLTFSFAPDEFEGPDHLRLQEADGFIVGFWRGQRFAYALIAKSTPLQMAEIASAIGAPRP